MNDHIVKTIALIQSKIDGLQSLILTLQELDAGDGPPASPPPAPPNGRESKPSSLAAVRNGRLGDSDRARSIILAIAGRFHAREAKNALEKAGIKVSVGSLLRRLYTAGNLCQPGRGAYENAARSDPALNPNRNRNLNPAAPADPPPATAAPRSVSEILDCHGCKLTDVLPSTAIAAEIGQTLSEIFTLTDMQARVGNARASMWIARWKEIGWLDTVGAFTYQRTKTFGAK
jgi:hypothetical protein